MASSIINSDDGVISGTSGLKTTGGDDGVLNIQNNGTTAVTVNASGNVGVGTTSPNAQVEVSRSATNGFSTIRWSNTGASGRTYEIGLGGNTASAGFANNLYFYDSTAAATRMSITSDGYLRMASGSGGIQFNGDTAAANALDDYEEGTFTPSIIGTSTDGTASYAVRVARYTKIGNRVFFNLYVEWSGGTGTGFLQLNGLPFTANSTSNNLPLATTHLGNVALSANNIGWSYVINGTDKFNISQMPTGGGAAGNVAYDAAGAMLLAGHYEV